MTPTNLSRVSASMNRLRLFVCCIVAVGLGCKKDATFTEPLPHYAAITWLNAIPDTMQLDVRVVDISTNASFMDADFRSAQPFPINLEPGARHIAARTPAGDALGSVCVIGHEPRTMNDQQKQALKLLANQVQLLLEWRRYMNKRGSASAAIA